MEIRPASMADAAELARLLEAFNGPPVTPRQAAARLAACQGIETTLLAWEGAQAVGFACLRLIPYMSDDVPYAELTELYVEPDFQRRGVGRSLVARVFELARRRGADELLVLTGRSNHDAQAFYRAVGFADWALAMRQSLL